MSFDTDRGPLRAVDGVSFTLDRGRTVGVVGESGSGKTVLARTVMGLLGGPGVSGSVRFEGVELVGAPPKALRSLWGARIAMVFQDPMTSLNPVMRIGRQITEPLRLHLGMDRDEARATALSLLGQVGIPSPEARYRSYPGQLSGGMRQRVMIAIAVACAPRLLLADEPTTGLDATVQAQILDLLAGMAAERRMAMVLVSHDLGVVATRTDHIVVMYAGRVVEQAPTRTLFSATAMPYTEALLRSIPRLADPSHTRLAAIDGRPPDPVDRPPGCPFAPRCRYARDLCHRQAPPLVAAETAAHRYACWFPLGGRQGPDPAAAPERAR
ncbi:MAG TPA: ABC transporter ATP-binding protein [Acidimicrobiales bacterium]|nr:ABC transporter ATP-binding protein [Acidimicrobiales bacterium]